MQSNNMKAMREALVALSTWAKVVKDNPKDKTAIECAEFVEVTAKTALAAPPRNCDVGTAEEQVERFKEYCQSNMQYYRDMFGTHEGAGGWDCKEDCPIGKMVDKNDSFCDHCELLWAQMPYESEVAE